MLQPISYSGENDSDTPRDSATNFTDETDSLSPGDTESDTDSTSDTEADSETDTYEYNNDAFFDAIGFATVPAIDVNALTGGSVGGQVVTVSDADAFQNAVSEKGDVPLYIYVNDTIRPSSTLDRIRIQEVRDLHIVGVGNSGTMEGIGLHIRDSANIIIRNLTIHHVEQGTRDAVTIDNTHHIWVDHCDLYNDRNNPGDYDGLLDISNGSDYITISWNRIHDNTKGLIVGNSDDTADVDALANHITYHHNWISDLSPGAVSFRFGQAHSFNNYFFFGDAEDTIGISSRMGACVRAELNRFNGITEPMKTNQSGDSLDTLGSLQSILNDWGNVSVTSLAPTCVLNPPYDYLQTVNSTANLPSLLEINTGVGIVE